MAQRVEVVAAADGALKWDRVAYAAKAGDVTFVVKNPSPLPHRFGVEGNGVSAHSKDLGAGKTGSYTLKGLQAGEYQIVCDFPGHKAAGMVAKLVVS
ncbi:MAG: plastocyanin/azurin family copper-binding protein [Thermomicrobiales bacterium]